MSLYKPLWVVFEGKSRRDQVSTIEDCERIFVTLIIYFSVFNKISLLLPVDVGTLVEPR